jgi:hypothetical protein
MRKTSRELADVAHPRLDFSLAHNLVLDPAPQTITGHPPPMLHISNSRRLCKRLMLPRTS